MCKVCEQCERFEDMAKNIKSIVQTNPEITVEERNLLSVAYKNSISSKRSAFRILSGLIDKEKNKVFIFII